MTLKKNTVASQEQASSPAGTSSGGNGRPAYTAPIGGKISALTLKLCLDGDMAWFWLAEHRLHRRNHLRTPVSDDLGKKRPLVFCASYFVNFALNALLREAKFNFYAFLCEIIV